jgi:hypothetical protein
MKATHVYDFRPSEDKHGFDLISDALPFFFRELRSAVFRRISWSGSASLLLNERKRFALLRVARIIFKSQMANDAVP